VNSQQRKTTHHWPSVSSNHRWSGITNHWHLGTLAQAQHVFWDGVSKCYASLAQHNDALQVERYDEPLALRVTNHRDTCLVCIYVRMHTAPLRKKSDALRSSARSGYIMRRLRHVVSRPCDAICAVLEPSAVLHVVRCRRAAATSGSATS